MTNTLYISSDYSYSPQVYKNFYKVVIEPKLLGGHGRTLSSSVFLADYNAHWDNPSKSIVFDTEQDLTYFMLKWS